MRAIPRSTRKVQRVGLAWVSLQWVARATVGCRIQLGSQAAGAAGKEPPAVAAFRTLFSGSLNSAWHIAQALLPQAAAPLVGWLAVMVPTARGKLVDVRSPSPVTSLPTV